MAQILHGSPVNILTHLTGSPIVVEVEYPGGGEIIEASLHRPEDGGRHGALVAVVGVTPAGRKDPRIVNLGDAFARAGYVVLIPDFKNLMRYRVSPKDVDATVASFQYLWSREFVDKSRVGMMGFCVGGALVTLAAEDPRINEKVRFITVMDGYYDILDMIQAMTTDSYTYKNETVLWSPLEEDVNTLAGSLIDCLPDEQDQIILKQMFGAGEESSAVNLRELSPSGKAMYELLTNRDPSKVGELASKLDPGVLSALESLSPSSHIAQLCTDVLIIHDIDDPDIPYVESLKLADAIHGRLGNHLLLTRMFYHVDTELPSNPILTIYEAVRFYTFLYHNLNELR